MTGPVKYEAPRFYLGTFPDFAAAGSKTGWVYAVNAATGKTIWRYHADSPVLSGVTPTAGGVVFSGDAGGDFLIFNARNGKLLVKQNLGGSMGSGVVTYSVAGKQYVATTTGNISRSGVSVGSNDIPRVVIMAAGLDRDYQPVKVAAVPPGDMEGHFGIDQSKALFRTFCSACHGADGKGGEGGPTLQTAKNLTFPELLERIRNPAPPVQIVAAVNQLEIAALARYIQLLP